MTRSRLSSKSSAKSGLLCSLLLLSTLLLPSCKPIEPTYKAKDIPAHIQRICKDEYGLDVIVQNSNNAIWIYMPLTKLLHEKFNLEKNNIFSETTKTTFINIMTSISRVILSSDKSPEFYVMIASDIELGIDYGIMGYALDMKKAYAGFIPPTELDRRFVIKFNADPQAIGDKEARHINVYDINFTDFLISQILQRIAIRLQSDELKDYLKIEALNGEFKNSTFSFTYKIREISLPKQKADIKHEILKIIAYCLNAYELKDYLGVELVDSGSGKHDTISHSHLSRLAKEF